MQINENIRTLKLMNNWTKFMKQFNKKNHKIKAKS